MDEQRLGELFRDAVGEPPPASFGQADVVAASRRAVVRRRGLVAGGALLGLALLSVALLTGGPLSNGSSARTHADPPPAGHPSLHGEAVPRILGTAPGVGTPTPRARCGSVDEALAGELAAVLAERGVAVTGPVGQVPGPCPPGSRAAAVPVPGGTWYVVVVPRGGPPEPVDVVRADGQHEHAVRLDGGRGLVLVAMPAVPGRPAPFGNDVADVAAQLATQLPGS